MKKSANKKSKAEGMLDENAETLNETVLDESQESSKSEEKKGRDFEAELAEMNDKHLRLYSEFENFRRRTARERLDLMNSAGKEIMEALLPVLDDFDRAVQSMSEAKDIKAVTDGVDLIHNKLRNIMEQRGLKSFVAKEQDFDPDFHEAVTKIPAPEMSGKVVDVLETGYMLHDKVLRYAKVVVGE
jgi:molecular chaperone GrpE